MEVAADASTGSDIAGVEAADCSRVQLFSFILQLSVIMPKLLFFLPTRIKTLLRVRRSPPESLLVATSQR